MSALENNKRLSKGCSMYDPCPICFKCMNKATHLYVRCGDCPVQFCGHNHKQRSYMIRRENFAISVSKKTYDKFKEASARLRRREEQANENKEA